MDLLKTVGAAGIALLCAGAAQATPVAFTVETATCALSNGAVAGCGADSRRDTGAINLGTADSTFYSLGLGGQLVLHFDQALTGVTTFFETTWGNPNVYQETANFSVSSDGVNWQFIGAATNWLSAGISTFHVAQTFTWLLLEDMTAGTTGDGFDLNALEVSAAGTPEVPAPAAAVLLGSALLAGGALRRRNRRAA